MMFTLERVCSKQAVFFTFKKANMMSDAMEALCFEGENGMVKHQGQSPMVSIHFDLFAFFGQNESSKRRRSSAELVAAKLKEPQKLSAEALSTKGGLPDKLLWRRMIEMLQRVLHHRQPKLF